MTVRTGSLLFLSGHGAFDDGKPLHIGRLGDDLSTEDGRLAAETVMANLLATVRARAGSLSAIARVVKVVVFVNSAPDFTDQHLVANGATDLLVHAFGKASRWTRPIGRRGRRPPARLRRRDRGHHRNSLTRRRDPCRVDEGRPPTTTHPVALARPAPTRRGAGQAVGARRSSPLAGSAPSRALRPIWLGAHIASAGRSASGARHRLHARRRLRLRQRRRPLTA